MGQGWHGTSRQTFFYGNQNDNYHSETGFFINKEIGSAVKRLVFVGDNGIHSTIKTVWYYCSECAHPNSR